MATDKNFIIKNGLTIGTTEVIDSSGNLVNTSGSISGTTITGSDRGTFEDLVLTGDTDDDLTFTVASGDWSIKNSQQNNGLVIYDGTAGVQLLYNNTVKLEILDSGIDVENGTISIAGTEFADNSRNITAGTISSGAITAGTFVSATDYMRVTATGGAKNILLGNQDSGGVDKPAIIQGVNGRLRLGHGNSWTTSGGTFTTVIDLASNNLDISTGALQMGSTTVIDSSRNLTNIGSYAGSGDITLTSGSNQVLLAATNGSLEITRSAGGPFIDFKDSTSDDFDARIMGGNALIFSTGGNGSTATALTLGSDQSATFAGTISSTGNVTHNITATQEVMVKVTNDSGQRNALTLNHEYDRDIGIHFHTTGGDYEVWIDSAGDDSLILSPGTVGDPALELYQNKNAQFYGNIIVSGTVDGRDIATDGTKLDTINTNADVTPSWVPSSDPGYITGLTFNGLSAKTSGTGEYSTSGYLTAGRGSGGVSLTHNDGYGNANVTFNHKAGVPEQNGNSARIEVNTDSTSDAQIVFGLNSNVSSGVAVQPIDAVNIRQDHVDIRQYLRHMGDDDTYLQLTADRVRIFAGGSSAFDSNNTYLTSTGNTTGTAGGLSGTPNITVGTISSGAISATSVGVTNIVTNKVVKFNGSIFDDSNITDTGSAITLGSNTTVSGTISSGAITASDSAVSSTLLTIGSSAQTNFTKVDWITSSHGASEAYILAYGAGHASQAGNFAIKNLEASSDIYFELAGSVEPLRLTSTGATFAGTISSGAITSTGNSQFDGEVQVGDTVSQNAFGLLQVNQEANNDESGIGILSSGAARSMRLWVDETSSYINSGNAGAGNLIFNEAITVSSGGNLTGVGTISSGAITSSGDISLTGGGAIKAPSVTGAESIALEAAGTITVRIDTNGNTGDDQFFKVLKHTNDELFTVQETGNATFAGTISSGAITATNGFKADGIWTSNEQPTGSDAIFSGYGAIGNRAAFYITNGGGTVQIGNGSVHNNNPTTTFSTSAVNLGASRVLQMNGTTVIDASRNLTNIGTISSGAITSTGTSEFANLNLGGVTSTGSSFLSGTQRIVSDGYIATQAIYNYAETGTTPAAIVFGNGSTYGSDQISLITNGVRALYIDSSQNITVAGTISSGAITSSGYVTASNAKMGVWNANGSYSGIFQTSHGSTGYAIIFDATNTFIGSGSSGTTHIRYDNNTSTNQLKVNSSGWSMGETVVMDSSRNLTNIGTISSGAITSSGDILGAGVYVGSANTSFDFYNNGTSYLNGATTVDDALDLTGSNRALKIAGTTVIDASRNLTNIAKITGNSASGGVTTFNVGRGDVYFENNSLSNANGAGITLRTSSNPTANTDGSIFDVRSSGQAARLWVGQDLTSAGYNNFYVGNIATGGEGTPASYEIELNATSGNITAQGNITAYGTVSDIRQKENIEQIDKPIERLEKIKGITFNYKKKSEDERLMGVIAQDLLEDDILKLAVYEQEDFKVADDDPLKHTYGVRYEHLTAILIEAVKEQQKQIEELKEEVLSLRSKN